MKGRITETQWTDIDLFTRIREPEQEEVYEYQGVIEQDGTQQNQMQEKVTKEYNRRWRLVLNTELNS